MTLAAKLGLVGGRLAVFAAVLAMGSVGLHMTLAGRVGAFGGVGHGSHYAESPPATSVFKCTIGLPYRGQVTTRYGYIPCGAYRWP